MPCRIDDLVQLNLFSILAGRRRLEVAIDELGERFGDMRRANNLNKPVDALGADP
jgi:hypothetical protein